jgi:hypothetical protein
MAPRLLSLETESGATGAEDRGIESVTRQKYRPGRTGWIWLAAIVLPFGWLLPLGLIALRARTAGRGVQALLPAVKVRIRE